MIQADDNGSHPDLDRWLAYRAGDLGREDEGTLQDHLVDCRSCTALVLDLEAFADPPGAGLPGSGLPGSGLPGSGLPGSGLPGSGHPGSGLPAADERAAATDVLPPNPPGGATELEQAAVWRGLRPQLRRRIADRRRWFVPTTVAASFLAAVLGTGLWLQQRELSGLRDQLAALAEPQANAPVYDLYPRAVLRGEPAPGAILEIPAAAPAFTLILNRVEPGELGLCRAEIADSQGRRWVVVDGLEMDEMGVFTFALGRGALAAGDYVVRLWGTDGSGRSGDQETLVEEYPLRIRYREVE